MHLYGFAQKGCGGPAVGRPPRTSEMDTTLDQEIHHLHAELCGGLADPTRILILYALACGPQNVSQLAAELDLSQPMTSRHLKVLRDRGLVVASRSGAVVTYRLADRRLITALDMLRAVLRDGLLWRASLAEAVPAPEA